MSAFGEDNLATFTLGDVVCPEARTALTQVGPDLQVVGRVVYYSDCGAWKDHFAIVEVGGLSTPVIVPAHRMKAVLPVEPAQTADAKSARIALNPGEIMGNPLAQVADARMESATKVN
jgi:hypothetical protein